MRILWRKYNMNKQEPLTIEQVILEQARLTNELAKQVTVLTDLVLDLQDGFIQTGNVLKKLEDLTTGV